VHLRKICGYSFGFSPCLRVSVVDLSAKQFQKRRVSKPREHPFQILIPQMPAHGFSQHLAEIRSQRQVAPFIELFRSKSGPATINFAAFYRPAQNKHDVRVPVVCPAITVLSRRAAEL
jgi:hypothetical protein